MVLIRGGKMKDSFKKYFKEIYGNYLSPNGFCLLKSKYPYFVRVTSDGIVQSISFSRVNPNKTHSDICDGFTIWIGLSLITLPLTDYNNKPNTLENEGWWMMPITNFFHSCSLSLDEYNEQHSKFSFYYQKDSYEDICNSLQESIKEFMPFVLYFFNHYSTLEEMGKLKGNMRFGFYRDVVIINQMIDEYIKEMESEFQKQLEQLVLILDNNPMFRLSREKEKEEFLTNFNRKKQWFLERKEGTSAYIEYMKNAVEIRDKNLQLLKELGVDISF